MYIRGKQMKMLRYLLFSICLSLTFGKTSVAQEFRLDSVQDHSFSGYMSSGNLMNGYFYYVLGRDGNKNTATLVVKTTNITFDNLNTIKIDIPRSAFVQASHYSENMLYFLIADPVEKSRTWMCVDMDGKIVKQEKEEKVDDKLLSADEKIYINNAMPMGITILQGSSKGSYTLSKFDDLLNKVWTKEITAPSGTSISVVSTKTIMDKLYVLLRETKNGKVSVITSKLTAYSLDDGSQLFQNTIKSDEDYCACTFFTEKENTCTIGGVYFHEGKYVKGGALGIMLEQYDEMGQLLKSVKLPFSALNSFLPDDVISNMGNTGFMLVLDGLKNEQGNYSFVCEMVDNNHVESAKQSEVKVSDLMIINTDIEGSTAEKVQLMRSVNPLTITLKGMLSTSDPFKLSSFLLNNKLLHYRFVSDALGSSALCYISFNNAKPPKAIFIPLSNPIPENEREPLLLRLPGIEDKVKWTTKFVLDDAALKSDRCKDWRKIDIVSGLTNTYRVYNFMAPNIVIGQERNFR